MLCISGVLKLRVGVSPVANGCDGWPFTEQQPACQCGVGGDQGAGGREHGDGEARVEHNRTSNDDVVVTSTARWDVNRHETVVDVS